MISIIVLEWDISITKAFFYLPSVIIVAEGFICDDVSFVGGLIHNMEVGLTDTQT